jgi:hypothetical protein
LAGIVNVFSIVKNVFKKLNLWNKKMMESKKSDNVHDTKDKLLEEKLGIKNVQVGFPLVPVGPAQTDILVQQTCNLGLLPYLGKLANDPAARNNDKGKGKTIKDFKLENGFPYSILNIGKRLDVKECSFPPGKLTEVREIEVIRNPEFIPPQVDPSKEVAEKILSSVLHIPIVSDMPWKQLCVALSKKYSRQKDKIIRQLVIPKERFDEDVAAILLNPANREILENFNKLREEVNDIHNSAYTECFIYALLSYISVYNWAPLFPRLYEVGRGQEATCILSDPQICPMWKEFVMIQHTESYYNDTLVMYSEIDLELLMAHLFQIVFGLDFAQRTLGFIHHNLDIRSAVGYVKMDPCIYLQYKWHDRYYSVPTNGQMIKLKNFEHASIVLNGVQHTAEKIESKHDKHSFNTDLVRLGATLRKVIQEKQLKTVAKHPEIEANFNKMIDKWVNCGNSLADRKFPSPKDIAMQEYRLKCLQAEDGGGICTWKKFGDVPSHTECFNAVPYSQQDFFKMFRVDKADLNNDALIYVLG